MKGWYVFFLCEEMAKMFIVGESRPILLMQMQELQFYD